MDFEDTPQEAVFRAEARAFLDKNAARKSDAKNFHRGRYIPEHNIPETIRQAKDWLPKLSRTSTYTTNFPRNASRHANIATGASHWKMFRPRS